MDQPKFRHPKTTLCHTTAVVVHMSLHFVDDAFPFQKNIITETEFLTADFTWGGNMFNTLSECSFLHLGFLRFLLAATQKVDSISSASRVLHNFTRATEGPITKTRITNTG
jgi:hypothetical protein